MSLRIIGFISEDATIAIETVETVEADLTLDYSGMMRRYS